jgi:hypothetical protein
MNFVDDIYFEEMAKGWVEVNFFQTQKFPFSNDGNGQDKMGNVQDTMGN